MITIRRNLRNEKLTNGKCVNGYQRNGTRAPFRENIKDGGVWRSVKGACASETDDEVYHGGDDDGEPDDEANIRGWVDVVDISRNGSDLDRRATRQ
jgi:hypothetical protein